MMSCHDQFPLRLKLMLIIVADVKEQKVCPGRGMQDCLWLWFISQQRPGERAEVQCRQEAVSLLPCVGTDAVSDDRSAVAWSEQASDTHESPPGINSNAPMGNTDPSVAPLGRGGKKQQE